jgi:hypothetical protein
VLGENWRFAIAGEIVLIGKGSWKISLESALGRAAEASHVCNPDMIGAND